MIGPAKIVTLRQAGKIFEFVLAAVGLEGQGSTFPRGGQLLERIPVVPGHPVGWMSSKPLRVLEQLGQVVEGIDAVQFAGVDQAHEQVPHVGPVFGL